MASSPFNRFRRWFAEAERAGVPQPEAMALATADRRARPALRYVLMKQADERGVVFFTNGKSRKGRELADNPRAAATFYWSALGKQVRFEGRVEPVSAGEADAYWKTRPRASQLAAAASHQSAPIARRSALMKRYRELDARFRRADVPRPLEWTGYRLVPDAIEFWIHAEHRLHRRELFVRRAGRWRSMLLQP